MLANLLIGLREGLEAALVVSILVAFLVRTGRRRELGRVWAGVAVATTISVGVTLALTLTQQALTFQAKETLGGCLSIVAVGFVTWMIFWMRSAGRTMSARLEGRLEHAVAMGSTAVVAMAALAVGREGLETAFLFFTAAQAAGGSSRPLVGFLIGLLLAVALAHLIYRGALKVDLRRFFSVTGGLLIFVAAGMLAYGVHDLQEAGLVPGLRTYAFGTDGMNALSAAVPPDSWYGTLIKATLNLTADMTAVQAAVWLVYAAVVMALFLRSPVPTKRTAAHLPA